MKHGIAILTKETGEKEYGLYEKERLKKDFTEEFNKIYSDVFEPQETSDEEVDQSQNQDQENEESEDNESSKMDRVDNIRSDLISNEFENSSSQIHERSVPVGNHNRSSGDQILPNESTYTQNIIRNSRPNTTNNNNNSRVRSRQLSSHSKPESIKLQTKEQKNKSNLEENNMEENQDDFFTEVNPFETCIDISDISQVIYDENLRVRFDRRILQVLLRNNSDLRKLYNHYNQKYKENFGYEGEAMRMSGFWRFFIENRLQSVNVSIPQLNRFYSKGKRNNFILHFKRRLIDQRINFVKELINYDETNISEQKEPTEKNDESNLQDHKNSKKDLNKIEENFKSLNTDLNNEHVDYFLKFKNKVEDNIEKEKENANEIGIPTHVFTNVKYII